MFCATRTSARATIITLLLVLTLTFTACQRGPTPTVEPTPAFLATATTQATDETPAYQNPALPIADRVDDLLSRMTLAEKVGQMTQVEKNSIEPQDITDLFIGSLLSGGGGYPTPNSADSWLEMVNQFQERALQTRLRIPLIYGVDAVHGHNNVEGATIFPHNVGLGATRDAGLVEHIGRATAREVSATGVHWNFAPVVAVPQDIRWGRTYEAYGEDTDLVGELGAAYVRGLQGANLDDPASVLATPKHYVGDGGTAWGTSAQYQIDQGDTQVDEATLRAVHLPPYRAAIEAGARSIMVSFSSWNGIKMHAQKYLLTDVLKGELGFDGFLISDWQAIDQIPGDYRSDVVTAINAGLDMIMVPYDYKRFNSTLTEAVEKGDVPMTRIDDAVRRILTVKFELGLFEQPVRSGDFSRVGSPEHRELAREAVRKSLVLLKNDNETLPIARDAPVVFVGGMAADDVGIQSGGWTIEWQGQAGNITPGTTILEGIEATLAPNSGVQYNRFGKFDNVVDDNGDPLIADVGVAVVGERPYAEGVGDSRDLSLSRGDLSVIERMRERSEKLVVILISGRPMIITDILDDADAVVAAWLPGTEGQGVADVLFGDYPFTGKLPYTWPRTADQLPFDFADLPAEGCSAPLFPYGYGLDAGQSGPLELPDCGSRAAETAAPSEATRVDVVDDFESGELPAGQLEYVTVGFLTWSDGSPVSIETVQVDETDESALPGQEGKNTVLQLNTDIKSSGWAGFSHAFANATLDEWVSQDWSSYEGLAVWVYGNGTGGTIFVDILDNRNPDSVGDDAERWTYDFIDDFEGWQYIQMPFEEFRRKEIGNGAPNDGLQLTEVHGYGIGAFGSAPMGQQNNYVDNVVLYGQAPERPIEVSFAEAQYGLRETGRATVRVKLNKKSEEAVTVDYAVAEGLATPDRDYEAVSGTLTFAPGETEQSFKFNAIDDDKAEGQEEVLLVLSNPAGAVLGFQRRAVVTIRDDENPDPSLIFDFDEAPPFVATGGVNLSVEEVAADAENVLPGQEGFENVMAVAYDTNDAGASFGQVFAEPQDWSYHQGLSFWDYGSNSGDTFILELYDNQKTTTADVAPEDWVLIWSDEFDDPAGTPANPSIWQPEIGDGTLNGIPGWGNNELEYYTASPENAATDGEGHLAITARQVNPETSDQVVCWYGPCEYTSARLVTWERAELAFGRVETRIKLPVGQGLWSAFWMLGTNLAEVGWPQSGEVDIVENLGKEPATVHGTIHGPGYSGGNGVGTEYDLPAGAGVQEFHTYAIEWTPDQIRWLVDDVNYLTVTPDDIPAGTEWVYNHPFFLILNLAVGGNWPGNPDETTGFPQRLLVDYVRVYGAPNASDRFEASFTDDFEGWRQIRLPFARFTRSATQPAGAPKDGLGLTEVWGYRFRVPENSAGSFFMDQIRFE